MWNAVFVEVLWSRCSEVKSKYFWGVERLPAALKLEDRLRGPSNSQALSPSFPSTVSMDFLQWNPSKESVLHLLENSLQVSAFHRTHVPKLLPTILAAWQPRALAAHSFPADLGDTQPQAHGAPAQPAGCWAFCVSLQPNCRHKICSRHWRGEDGARHRTDTLRVITLD